MTVPQHDLFSTGNLIISRDIEIDIPEWKAAFLLMQADKIPFWYLILNTR
jgi:hypothetical protein